MEIKQIIKIELEDNEISALQTIARIDCNDIENCNDCPLDSENGECLKLNVKRALIKSKITW